MATRKYVVFLTESLRVPREDGEKMFDSVNVQANSFIIGPNGHLVLTAETEAEEGLEKPRTIAAFQPDMWKMVLEAE